MPRRALILGLLMLSFVGVAGLARASIVARVRQGSVEWTITPIMPGRGGVQGFYSYGNPDAACANTGLESVGTSLLFFYDDLAVIGPSPSPLALIMIHDAPGNSAGGAASFDISGLPSGAAYAIRDDPADTYAPDPPSGGQTTATWSWGASDADGAAIDGIGSAPFCLAIQPNFGSGITTWKTLDGPDRTTAIPFTIPTLVDTVHVCVSCLSLTCATPAVMSCDGATAFVPVRAIGASLCGTSTITNDRTSGGADASDTYPLGQTDVTFTMVDSVGFTSTCVSAVIVSPNPTPPAITNCPPPLTLDCAGLSDVPASDPRVQDWFTQFAATDDCVGVALSNDAPALFPAGCRGSITPVLFTATDASGNIVTCSSDVTVRTECVALPLNVGGALRVISHGDAHAADITATFEWSRDEGLPRSADEHYVVLRGITPQALAQVPGTELWTDVMLSESTPAATSLPLVHFYAVLAAGPCGDVSAN